MAVYTPLDAATLAELIARYDVGTLVAAKGIAEGVSNSNWLVETTGAANGGDNRFILTVYERRIDIGDLPFFLALLDHLATRGCPVPRTVPARDGQAYQTIGGKAAALIQFLPGLSVERPTPGLVREVGRALAGIHLAAADFPLSRAQTLGLPAWRAMAGDAGKDGLTRIDADLPRILADELAYLDTHWPTGLPRGAIHADLFPDNVLTLDDTVTGLIDFYFAATDFFAYDLAVTHAAWCFTPGESRFRADLSAALLEGYAAERPLGEEERAALPVLARGAAVRFIASRALDWLETPASATVRRKDPVEFVRRLAIYQQGGAAIFTSACRAGR